MDRKMEDTKDKLLCGMGVIKTISCVFKESAKPVPAYGVCLVDFVEMGIHCYSVIRPIKDISSEENFLRDYKRFSSGKEFIGIFPKMREVYDYRDIERITLDLAKKNVFKKFADTPPEFKFALIYCPQCKHEGVIHAKDSQTKETTIPCPNCGYLLCKFTLWNYD